MLEVCKRIQNHHADANTADTDRKTLLHHASQGRHVATVQLLLMNNANGEALSRTEEAPLQSAVEPPGAVVVLLDNGAVPGVAKVCKLPALHLTARNGRLATVEHLLDKKPDVKAPDEEGKTPFYYPIHHGNLKVLGQLWHHRNSNIDYLYKVSWTVDSELLTCLSIFLV